MEWMGGSGFFSRFELNRLVLEELFKAEFTVLTAVAGLFVAAKRRIAVERRAVDIHLAGAHATRHRDGVFVGAAPNAAAQTVNRVIGDANGFVFVLVSQHHQHRAENFFPRQGVVRLDPQCSRMHEIAFVKRRFVRAACDEFSAFFQTLLNEASHAFALRGGDQRT